jgi:5-methylcytosine-specific restriction endonuclease McrA
MSMPTENLVNTAARAAAKAAGLKRYSIDMPCARGHMADRYVSTGGCVMCQRESSSAYYEDHLDEAAAYAKSHREENPEMYRERSRVWSEVNRESETARMRAYRAANPEHTKAVSQAYYEANKPAFAARSKAWQKANPEAMSAIWRNRRALELGAEGWHTKEDIDRIREQQRGCCAYCRVKLSKVVEHVDHIIPLYRGGTNWPANLQILCPRCNSRKCAKDPIDFAKEFGFLL